MLKMKNLTKILVLGLLLLSFTRAEGQRNPERYGRVVLDNYSGRAGLSAVVFDHWVHRARFTCRVCHVDVGFAMEAGETGIRAADNAQGYYCGACHGRIEVNGKKLFAACSEEPLPEVAPEEAIRCDRCHSKGKAVPKKAFRKFAEKLPKAPLDSGINWEKAEDEKLITPSDFLEGVSIERKPMKPQEDFGIKSRGSWMPDIVFSHKKHVVWNGCELCHPDIFTGVKKGASRYTMFEIYEDKYCGVCHGKVAFPLQDCQKCHISNVR